ncbi:chemotaxis protein CheW [Isoptericola sp. b441]|uniref:Chemotaxis protein CheW n=1 Tax=Actinotalea lenta TaxID=3064654 RepID=A0ABT9D6N0_9CELL|nr:MULTISPECIES: chemotaxis protein CheW [unclassified Isoptericola]MDO8105819.1 chemotaxis protein CheW [Isoptericola sp. b441]MDO8122524.1 chemotaxis protein CheW [Isoptericola sp. b490]
MTSTTPAVTHPSHTRPAGQARELIDLVRWAPAPRWEGGAGARARYLAYLLGSMLAWTAAGLGVAAALGRLTGLAG